MNEDVLQSQLICFLLYYVIRYFEFDLSLFIFLFCLKHVDGVKFNLLAYLINIFIGLLRWVLAFPEHLSDCVVSDADASIWRCIVCWIHVCLIVYLRFGTFRFLLASDATTNSHTKIFCILLGGCILSWLTVGIIWHLFWMTPVLVWSECINIMSPVLTKLVELIIIYWFSYILTHKFCRSLSSVFSFFVSCQWFNLWNQIRVHIFVWI